MLRAKRVAINAMASRAVALRAASTSTQNPDEISKFSKLARLWWDEDSAAFGALHRMNQVRVPIVVEAAIAAEAARGDVPTARSGRTIRPLARTSVLDVGSGGGILAEALARVGATVTGLDASAENVAAASAHSVIDPDIAERVFYEKLLVEDLAAQLAGAVEGSVAEEPLSGAAARAPAGGFDVVVSSEVIEHVNSPAMFVAALAACLRPGGVLVMTTITRTALSYAGAIFAAEQLAGLVPPGTHDFAKFLRPDELSGLMVDAGLVPALPEPIAYNPITGRWSRGGGRVVMQYALSGTKPLQ